MNKGDQSWTIKAGAEIGPPLFEGSGQNLTHYITCTFFMFRNNVKLAPPRPFRSGLTLMETVVTNLRIITT